MERTTRTIEGAVKRDPYGSWSDCSPGLYLDGNNIEDIFRVYRNRKIRVTIEELPSGGDSDD